MARTRQDAAGVKSTTDEAPSVQNFRPVRWFLGGAIAGKLRQIIKGAFISNELNLRDWMAFPQDSCEPYRVRGGSRRTDVWFDFIADTGDDSRTMEVMAACFSQDIEITDKDRAQFRSGGREQSRGDARLGDDLPAQGTHGGVTLPRGEFLFMGGDTAYVVADEATIHDRVVAPFNRGFKYAQSLGRTSSNGDDRTADKRPLFGIPGNHDYYDELVGFNRMFRKAPPRRADSTTAPLHLDGFCRVQDASYMRIQLPGDWELWGTDFWNHPVDYRQRAYFRPNDHELPANLILCTPTPPIVFGGDLTTPCEQESYGRLLGTQCNGDDEKARWNVGEQLTQGLTGKSLLLLSGDKHHYARYQSDHQDDKPSMICVVSGGGGAFLHPTETDVGPFKAKLKYPSEECSRKHTATRLARFLDIYAAGLVWLVGAVLAWSVSATVPPNLLGEPPFAELRFWLIIAGAVAILVGHHRVVKWFALQRLLHYAKETGRTRQDDKAPSRFYEAVRKKRFARWAGHLGLPRLGGAILRAAVICTALALPYVTSGWWFDDSSAMTILFLGIVILIAIALFSLGWFLGGAVAQRRKPWFGLLGLCHAIIQLGCPLVLVRYATWSSLPWIALTWAVFGLAGWSLYKRGRAAAVVVWLLWIAQAAVLVLVLPVDATPHEWNLGMPLLFGALVTPIQLSWYLLVAGCFDGHNNEIGVAIRSTRYKQWIRFHVTPAKVTGYVIGIDDPLEAWAAHQRGSNPTVHAKLRDVFTLHATPRVEPANGLSHAITAT